MSLKKLEEEVRAVAQAFGYTKELDGYFYTVQLNRHSNPTRTERALTDAGLYMAHAEQRTYRELVKETYDK
jgi:hypothetical protein